MRHLFISLVVGTLATACACFAVSLLALPMTTSHALDLALCVGVAAGAYAGLTSLMFR